MSNEEQFVELRGMLQESPSREGWLGICNWVEQRWREAPEQAVELYIPYIHEHAVNWDTSLRMAPHHWCELFVNEGFPPAFFSVVSAMTFVPLIVAWSKVYGDDREVVEKAFVSWCKGLPDDVHPLEGLHWNYCDAVAGERELYFGCYTVAQLQALLSSSLCRELRVLDVSVREFESDLWSPSQDDSCAYLYFFEIVEALQGESLEVLLAQGQPAGERMIVDRVGKSGWNKLAHLHTLHMGLGFPLGDREVSLLIQHLPALQSLFLEESGSTRSQMPSSLKGCDSETISNLSRYWSVYNPADFALSRNVLKALLNHPTLQNLVMPFTSYDTDKMVKDAKEKKPDFLTMGLYGGGKKEEEARQVFEWEHYFSL